jgi:hypothetical protein
MIQIRNRQCIVEGHVRDKSPTMPIKIYTSIFSISSSHEAKVEKLEKRHISSCTYVRNAIYPHISRSKIAMKLLLRISISVFPISGTWKCVISRK